MLRIVYNGLERADFVYYLSVILSTKSNRVIVNDSSKSRDLFRAVSHQSTDKTYEWNNVIFTQALDEADTKFESDDIFIDYRGMNIEEAHVDEALDGAYHLVMPDFTEIGVSHAKLVKPEGEAIYILRDACSRKITEKSFAIDCNLDKDEVAGHIELSSEDMAAYVALTHNGKQKFNKCSQDMIMALKFVTGTVLSMKNEKEVSKIVANANKTIK